MTSQHKAYKFKIETTPELERRLRATVGACRFMWNVLVEDFNAYGKIGPRLPTDLRQLKMVFPWLGEVSSDAVGGVIWNFKAVKKQFFDKKRKKPLGRMKFKSKRQSMAFAHDRSTVKIVDDKIFLPKMLDLEPLSLKGRVSIKDLQDKGVEFRNFRVKELPSGEWQLTVLVKEDVAILPMTGKSVGIDLGLNDLFIFSNGFKINNPRWFRENQTKLAKEQRKLSKKTKGSGRYNRQRLKVAEVHRKIAAQRKWFLDNISKNVVESFDFISIENLNVAGMKKSNLAKSVSDAGWSSFVWMLEYKSAWYGKQVHKIDRFYPSSKTCSCCGMKVEKLPLSIREWECASCGTTHDRDLNAATNILRQGLRDVGVGEAELSSVLARGEFVRPWHGSIVTRQDSVKREDCLDASFIRFNRFKLYKQSRHEYKTDAPKAITASEPGKFTVVSFIKPE